MAWRRKNAPVAAAVYLVNPQTRRITAYFPHEEDSPEDLGTLRVAVTHEYSETHRALAQRLLQADHPRSVVALNDRYQAGDLAAFLDHGHWPAPPRTALNPASEPPEPPPPQP